MPPLDPPLLPHINFRVSHVSPELISRPLAVHAIGFGIANTSTHDLVGIRAHRSLPEMANSRMA